MGTIPSRPRVKLIVCYLICFVIILTISAKGQTGQQTNTPKTGLIFADPARYQSIPLALRPISGILPASVDLSATFPRPGDQGNQSSCVGWAVAYALKSYQEKQERNWLLDTKEHLFSPAYIYNQIKVSSDCSGGSTFIEALDLLTLQGVAPLSLFDYDKQNCSRKPDARIKQAAQPFAIASWRRVNVQDSTEIKSHLAAGFPVLIGVEVDRAFMNLAAGNLYTRYDGNSLSGHALVVIGYDDSTGNGTGGFKVINSWGTTWADNGFGWISYQALRQIVREGYVAQDIINPNPVPPNPNIKPDPKPNPISFDDSLLGTWSFYCDCANYNGDPSDDKTRLISQQQDLKLTLVLRKRNDVSTPYEGYLEKQGDRYAITRITHIPKTDELKIYAETDSKHSYTLELQLTWKDYFKTWVATGYFRYAYTKSANHIGHVQEGNVSGHKERN